MVGIFCPAIEVPVCRGKLPSTAHEDRARVARPDAIGGPMVKADRTRESATLLQNFAGALFRRGVVDNDVDFFSTGKMADDLRVDMGNAGELARPVILVVRPGDPS